MRRVRECPSSPAARCAGRVAGPRAHRPPALAASGSVAEVLPAVTYVETRSVAYVREKGTGRGIGTVSLTATCSVAIVVRRRARRPARHCVDPADVADSPRRRLAA